MIPRFLSTSIQRLGVMAGRIDAPPSNTLFLMAPNAPLGATFAAADVLPVERQSRRAPPRPYLTLGNGLAAVPIFGALSKYPSLLRLLGLPTAATTVEIGAAIRAAADAADVRGLFLLVDSPGGTIAGIEALAGEVVRAARMKPVHSYGSDNACSAALWIATQASRFTVNKTAHVGSIGTAMVLVDSSEAAAREGLRFVAITTGPHKTAGYDGLPVTAEQVEAIQATVNTVNGHFLAALVAGRGLSLERVRTLATGRIFVGQQAVDVGLADAVESLDEALEALAAAAGVSDGELPLVEQPSGETGALPEARGARAAARAALSHRPATVADVDRMLKESLAKAPRYYSIAEAEERVFRDLEGSASHLATMPERQLENVFRMLVEDLTAGREDSYRWWLGLASGQTLDSMTSGPGEQRSWGRARPWGRSYGRR